jgi:VIT1/CCC1 family predicted Fe2+/Mn2+ transporter
MDLATLDAAIGTLSGILNVIGASQTVSEIVARRVAEGGRPWTDEERALVQQELAAAKAYAAEQISRASS